MRGCLLGLEEKGCGVKAWRRRVFLGGRDRRWKHYNFIRAVDILWGGAWIGGGRRGHTYIYTYTELPWNSVKGCENSGREIAIQRCINKTAVPGWFCEDGVVQVTTGRDGCCVRAPGCIYPKAGHDTCPVLAASSGEVSRGKRSRPSTPLPPCFFLFFTNSKRP